MKRGSIKNYVVKGAFFCLLALMMVPGVIAQVGKAILYIPGQKALNVRKDLEAHGFGHLDTIESHFSFVFDDQKRVGALRLNTTDGVNDFFTIPLTGGEKRVTVIFKARGAKDADTGTPFGVFWVGWQRGEYQALLRHNHSNQIKGSTGQTSLKPDDIVSDWHEFRMVFEVESDEKAITARAYVDGKLRHETKAYVKQSTEWAGAGHFIAFGENDGSTNGFARYLYVLVIPDEDVQNLSLEELGKRLGYDLTKVPLLVQDQDPPSKRPATKPAGITMLASEVRKEAGWVDPAAIQNNEIDLSRLPYSKNKAEFIDPRPILPDLKKLAGSRPVLTVVPGGGSGTYATIKDAIDAAQPGSVIYIKKGLYREKLKITKPDITLLGESPVSTIIYGYEADTGGIDGNILVDVSLNGESFNAVNLTFYNKGAEWNKTWGSSERRSVTLATRNVGQGVIRNCLFLGQQDTMYLRSGRLYFENCYIEGEVDFICGGATVLFQRCHIHSIYYPQGGYITAAAPADSGGLGFDNGYVFNQCLFTADPALQSAKPVFLGRGAWTGGSNGKGPAKVVIMNSRISALSGQGGWTDWDNVNTADKQFFREYRNEGEGAVLSESPTRRFLTEEEYRTTYQRPELILGYTPKLPW